MGHFPYLCLFTGGYHQHGTAHQPIVPLFQRPSLEWRFHSLTVPSKEAVKHRLSVSVSVSVSISVGYWDYWNNWIRSLRFCVFWNKLWRYEKISKKKLEIRLLCSDFILTAPGENAPGDVLLGGSSYRSYAVSNHGYLAPIDYPWLSHLQVARPVPHLHHLLTGMIL